MGLHLDPKAKAAPKARAGDGRAKKITFRSVDELVARNTQLMGDLRQAEAAQKKVCACVVLFCVWVCARTVGALMICAPEFLWVVPKPQLKHLPGHWGW